MNKVVWIIGANATGKTTQSKLLHFALNLNSNKVISELHFINSKGEVDKTSFTLYDNSAHVGALRDNQCTGTDSLSTKDQIEMAYLSISSPLIVIDGIMATGSWVDMIKQVNDIETYIILLNFDKLEDNLERVQERRWQKKPTTANGHKCYEELNEKTIKNITGKWRGFYSLYCKVYNQFDHYTMIEATLSKEEINKQILNFIQ